MPANVSFRRCSPWRAMTTGRARAMSACVLLVLAGVFGMHGLSGHGMPTDNAEAMMGPIAAPMSGGHAAHQAHVVHPFARSRMLTGQHRGESGLLQVVGTVASHTVAPESPGSTESSVSLKPKSAHDHGHMGGMAAGLCLAILAGILLGLAVRLSAHRQRPLFEELLRRVPLPRPRGRDRDPPSPALLSVWRC